MHFEKDSPERLRDRKEDTKCRRSSISKFILQTAVKARVGLGQGQELETPSGSPK